MIFALFERKDLFESYKNISVILLENELRKISLSEKVLNFKKENDIGL